MSLAASDMNGARELYKKNGTARVLQGGQLRPKRIGPASTPPEECLTASIVSKTYLSPKAVQLDVIVREQATSQQKYF